MDSHSAEQSRGHSFVSLSQKSAEKGIGMKRAWAQHAQEKELLPYLLLFRTALLCLQLTMNTHRAPKEKTGCEQSCTKTIVKTVKKAEGI